MFLSLRLTTSFRPYYHILKPIDLLHVMSYQCDPCGRVVAATATCYLPVIMSYVAFRGRGRQAAFDSTTSVVDIINIINARYIRLGR